FLAITFAVCVFFFVKNRSHLQSEHKLESLVSRESSFLFNNLLLLVACFTVLWGTLFPVLSECVQVTKVTVGPPFFNCVHVLFVRGGSVIGRHTGQNLFASMVQLAHRNTRRYGGYIVHFGVIVIMIGFAGAAFNQEKEKEMGYGDKMAIGTYTLVCRSYTQE